MVFPSLEEFRPRCELDLMRIQKISEGMDLIEQKITEFADRFVSDPMIMSRITGVGVLTKKDALRLAATGPTLKINWCGLWIFVETWKFMIPLNLMSLLRMMGMLSPICS